MQLPSLTFEDGDEKIDPVQSVAILNFLARKYSLYGKNDIERAQIDTVVGGAYDVRK